MDSLIAYNHRKWGGRYNPIISTDGQTLSDSDWKLLEWFDPDIVKTFDAIDASLAQDLERVLSPYSVEVPPRPEDPDRFRPWIFDEGLSVLPSTGRVRSAIPGIRVPSLVLFKTDSLSDPLLKSFIVRNIGTYDYTMAENHALEQVATKSFSISDRASFGEALSELAGFGAYSYPCQTCALPNYLKDVRHDLRDNVFTVVVGDSLDDVLYYWNRVCLVERWRRTYFNQVWLSTELADDLTIREALGRWLQRLADRSGTTNEEINFVSVSMDQNYLDQLSIALMSGLPIRRHATRIEAFKGPVSEELPFYAKTSDSALHRVTGKRELIVLDEPAVEEGSMGGERWVADVYIEYGGSANTIQGSWWQFPARNVLARDMFERTARIGRNGIPSVVMQRGSPTLKFKLLDKHSIFSHLIVGSRLRSPSSEQQYSHIAPSNSGSYLSGVLDLFGGLHSAYRVFESRYWRRLFDMLARNTPTSSDRIQNKIKKVTSRNPAGFLSSERGQEWLAAQIQQLSKQHIHAGREIPFSTFAMEGTKEIQDYNARRSTLDGMASFNESDLKESLVSLIEMNVLQVGVRPRCPRCGFGIWYHVDETKQLLICKGCGFGFPVGAEERWFYRLNTLVQGATVEHGLAPVILVLGQLQQEARNCFMMAPCMDLFDEYDKPAITDLDIVCVVDGQFIIGEVKQSNVLFDQHDFDILTDIAKRVRPTKVIFSSLENEPNGFIADNIDAMSTQLKPHNVHVEWYRIWPSVFDACHWF